MDHTVRPVLRHRTHALPDLSGGGARRPRSPSRNRPVPEGADLPKLSPSAPLHTLIELTEGVGLWLGQRWGEYFAMVATSVFLPYEVYDLTVKITWLRVGALVINLLLVVYLVWTKRLFGVRGGRQAYEARLRTESFIEVEQAALAAAAPDNAGSTPR